MSVYTGASDSRQHHVVNLSHPPSEDDEQCDSHQGGWQGGTGEEFAVGEAGVRARSLHDTL